MEIRELINESVGSSVGGARAGHVVFANARIAAVSATTSNPVRPKSAGAAGQALFLASVFAGGAFLYQLDPAALPAGEAAPVQLMLGAAVLAGFGIQKAVGFTRRLTRRAFGLLSRRAAVTAACNITAVAAALRAGRSLLGGL